MVVPCQRLDPYYPGKRSGKRSTPKHETAGWRAVDMGDTIPLELAFVGQPEITDAMRERARQLASDYA